jgi:site-specific DNA-methyltransferase (adenine-specific)
MDEIKFDKRNYRLHNDENKRVIKKSLKELGAGRSIVIDKDGEIIAGNGVYEQAKKLGIKTKIVETDGSELVVVKRTDLATGDEKRKKLALADNAASDTSEWANDLLREDWTPEVLADFGVELPGFETMSAEEAKDVQEDNFDEEKDKVETVCKKGDIWLLGQHRLMCGSSLDPNEVVTLLDGNEAPLTFTDPPYRLATVGGGVLKTANSMKQIRENGVDEFEPLKLQLYSKTNIYSHNKPLIKDYILLAEREDKPYDLAIYKKQGLPNYAGHMMTDIEYIAIIGDQGPKKGYDFDTYSKLFVGNKDKENDLSYSKPIALCAKFIKLYSDNGDIVLDLFGGSGSTLIACEQLNRKCYMMKLDPHYCDVIIARWEKLTGQKATRL